MVILLDVSRNVGETEDDNVLEAFRANIVQKRRLDIQEIVEHPLWLVGLIIVNNLQNDRLTEK